MQRSASIQIDRDRASPGVQLRNPPEVSVPALPVSAQTIKCQVNFSYGADNTCLVRFYIHYTGTAPTAAQLNTFAASIVSAWNTNLLALSNANFVGAQVICTDLNSNLGAVGFAAGPGTGTRAGVSLAAGTAFMIQFLILRRYRGGKPKIFLPFGVGADLATGLQWTAAFQSSVASAWSAFITAVLAAGWTGAGTLSHINVSYYTGFHVVTNPVTGRVRNVPNPRGTVLQDAVVSYSIETGVASQRRRNLI